MFEDFVSRVDPTIHQCSGSVFYSGRSAFSAASDLYILGLNPGGCPVKQAGDTIRRNIDETLNSKRDWSAYQDRAWTDKPPGTHGMQPRVLHLLRHLGREPRRIPASNLIFVRSQRERHLKANKDTLFRICWPFHAAVIEELCISVVLCFGNTAGRLVRDELEAHEKCGAFQEVNRRRWTSQAHRNTKGQRVVTLTHPSIAKWDAPEADPTELVKATLSRCL